MFPVVYKRMCFKMIQITQTHAQIGIDMQHAKINIQTKQPSIDIKQQQAKVEINKQPVQVEIDQYACLAEMGRKNSRDFINQGANKGSQKAMQYVTQTAAQGDRMAAIETGEDVIVEIAKTAFDQQKELSIAAIPKSRPKVSVKGGVDVNMLKGQMNLQIQRGSVSIFATQPKTNIYLTQKPSIQIQAGRHINIGL